MNVAEFKKMFKYTLPIIYYIGCIVIIVLTIFYAAKAHFNAEGPGSTKSQGKAQWTSSVANTSPEVKFGDESFTELVIKPIVESKMNQIIFKGLFFLFLWMMLFLVVPVAFYRLTKFKFFSVEIEVQSRERATVEYVAVSSNKAQLMDSFTSALAYDTTFKLVVDENASYVDILNHFLEETKLFYLKHFEAGFHFKTYDNVMPDDVKELVQASKDNRKAISKNKDDPDNPFKASYLVFYYPYEASSFVVTVIKSYTIQYDLHDQYLITLLHSTIKRNVDSIGLTILLYGDT